MIIYLHGFRSSPLSIKAQTLKKRMAHHGLDKALWCGQLPPSPRHAVELVEQVIKTAPTPPTLVGSSLGGFYATFFAERYRRPAVLINPVVLSGLDPKKWLGQHTMIYSGERFEFTQEDVETLQALNPPTLESVSSYWLLVEKGDETLDYRHALPYYAGARQTVLEGGNHSFSRWEDYLDAIISFAGLNVQKE